MKYLLFYKNRHFGNFSNIIESQPFIPQSPSTVTVCLTRNQLRLA